MHCAVLFSLLFGLCDHSRLLLCCPNQTCPTVTLFTPHPRLSTLTFSLWLFCRRLGQGTCCSLLVHAGTCGRKSWVGPLTWSRWWRCLCYRGRWSRRRPCCAWTFPLQSYQTSVSPLSHSIECVVLRTTEVFSEGLCLQAFWCTAKGPGLLMTLLQCLHRRVS